LSAESVGQPEVGRVVVVGAGLAGLRTAEQLRRRGFGGRIELIGAERHLPYDRPPLSKQLLRAGGVDPWLRTADELRALDVTMRLGAGAVGLDVDKQVVLTDAAAVPYDAVVIATGAVPRRVPGLGGRVLRTLDEAHALRSALSAAGRLAVVGAGLIGCEVAASARSLGLHVDLVDVLEGPLIRVVGPAVAPLVADLHAGHGVALHLGAAVASAQPGGLTLGSGAVLPVDVVLEAVGAVPETGWLAGSGLALGDGVRCDEDGRAAPSVYGVGDVARWAGRRHEHWTNAGVQADRVAAAILGQERPPPEVPYWWSDQYDVKLQGLGTPAADDDVELVRWGPRSRTVAVYSCAGRLTGVVGFSAAAAVMRLRGDVAGACPVDEVLSRLNVSGSTSTVGR
jgi:3-phenylpropionate/trans-cinnamate dioxygenase ferredoxin reductase subunit